jgi:hypothetical protein
MEIYTDEHGVTVNAIDHFGGELTNGHLYEVVAGGRSHMIHFQRGAIPEVGLNGLTTESLLVVLSHRIRFLDWRFPCRENKHAVRSIEDALFWLEQRTRERKARGVEGKELL